MPKIKEIEIRYNEKNKEIFDPLNQTNTVCIKVTTTKGLHGEFVELPDNPEIRDVLNAVNLLLSRCKDMTI